MKRITVLISILLFNSLVYAKTGLLFNISEQGNPISADVILCLNGIGPLSCQNYHISKHILDIRAAAIHRYPAAGIKVVTAGYQARRCRPYRNGYCLFALDSQTPTTIILNGNTPDNHTVGGTITGLVGSVSLQNNGGDTLIQNTDGNFTFTTPIAPGATYNVTVSSQPATQTCTVNNGTGIMGGTNVTNVQVTCATNSYTVGGAITGLVGSVSLQNNGGDTLVQSTNGNFTFTTPVAQGAAYIVTVSSQPPTQVCTVTNGTGTMGGANVTNVNVSCVNTTSSISVSATGIIPVNSGSGSITVTNNGPTSVTDVEVTLPAGWTSVVQDASQCTSLTPGNSCVIRFTTTLPYIARGNLLVMADNASNIPTTALAFTVQGYLVWEITDPSTVQVIGTSNNQLVWGGFGTELGPDAQSLTDGVNNTLYIVSQLLTSTNYAARFCNENTSGGASIGTWYLPAICQMGSAGQGAGCAPGLPNIYTNLAQFGFGGFSPIQEYWSSTESTAQPLYWAWYQSFVPNPIIIQGGGSKGNPALRVRCARSLPY